MWKYHLKIALRSLMKNRLFTGLNILGLSLGLCVASLLLLYVLDELSFNKSYPKLDQLYRVVVTATFGGETEKLAQAPNAVGPTAKENIAQVKEQVRFLKHNFGDKAFVNYEDKRLIEENLYWADSSVFEIFDINIVQGRSEGLLAEPNQLALSESAAKRYFGDLDPINKVLTIDQNYNMTVMAVYEDFPDNVSMDADLIGSFANMRWAQRLTWSNSSFETYLLLEESTDPADVEAQLSQILDDNVKKDDQWYTLSLQAMEDIHFFSSDMAQSYNARPGDLRQVELLIYLAIIILVIACINYMNMSTARSQRQAKEVGITKTIGAKRSQLIRRFYMETIVLVGISLMMELLLISIFLPFFNQMADKSFEFVDLLSPIFVLGSIGIAFVIVLLSGSYPALYLSSFSPKSLFNQLKGGPLQGGDMFRKGLVVVQFLASVVIIVATLVLNEQLRFIQKKDLGYKPDFVVGLLTSGARNGEQIGALMSGLKQIPEVEMVGRSQTFPGKSGSGRTLTLPQDEKINIDMETNRVSPEIIDVLGLNLLAGKTLPDRQITNEDSIVQVVLNEKAASFLGYTPEEAIGHDANGLFWGKKAEIVGVVENFHSRSFHHAIGGYAFHNNPSEWRNYALVKLHTQDLEASMQKLKRVFEENIPESAFDYTFLDQHVETLYRTEKRYANIFLTFSILSIVVACLGLFGLSAYTAERRTKEIGIRKVLGASVAGIISLLSREFLKLVLISFVIAMPLAWYLMDKWLENFTYKIDITAGIFLLAGILALCISFITVSAQSFKAAIANPINSLRNE